MPNGEAMRCLVIGNGKSLKDIPLDFLKRYPSFGSNRIYLLDGFTPDYYACVNPLVAKQYSKEIARMKSEKYICAKHAHLIPGSTGIVSISNALFSFRPDCYLYEGYTVTYVLLQLAFWKGYREVGLIGVDHDYVFEGAPNQELKAEGEDHNHFHPDYFSGGVKWNAPDLAKSEEAYEIARQVYTESGRRIINLTPGSKLDVFPREDWTSWLE